METHDRPKIPFYGGSMILCFMFLRGRDGPRSLQGAACLHMRSLHASSEPLTGMHVHSTVLCSM